ncbi:MAG TPA: LacI family DNA-binding transcriptional regulator [Arachnia sp.]|nr:LacI family DNA-binding transcriptional regulator [Arachnia sp.]HMT86231.1 LacI family DNA-binding transcriptional regulator [Arachnia sp.]
MTISDIARLAGVSTGAVSFALNGRPGVSDSTRQRILEIAKDLDWQPNSAARALVGGNSGVIGLVISRPARTLGAEAFFADLIAGIQSGLSSRQAGLQMLLVRDVPAEIAAYRRWHNSRQVDGVLLLDPLLEDPRIPALNELGIPAVIVGSRPSPPGMPPTAWVDDIEAASTLFDYLAAIGHHDIAYVAGPAALEHTRLRTQVLRGLEAHGVRQETIVTDYSPAHATMISRQLLSRRQRPSVIVYDNDVMAVAGLRVAQEMGVAVPQDISIASFDDSVIAELMHPSITCLTRDTFELGERAARLLLAQVDSPEPLDSLACPSPVLTVRESTIPPLKH